MKVFYDNGPLPIQPREAAIKTASQTQLILSA